MMQAPPRQSELASLEIRVNGRPLPQQAQRDLQQAAVEEMLDAAGMFTLLLYNWDSSRQRFSWSDDGLFAPGNEVELRFGTVDRTRPVMVGEITGLEPLFEPNAPRTLLVRGYDHRHRLMRGRHTHAYANLKDSDIARQIARRAGLGAQVTDSGTKLAHVLQHRQTDLEFLQVRAARLGYEVFVRDKILYFRRPRFDRKPTETLSLDRDIIAFYPRLTTMSQVSNVAVQGWDVAQKQPVRAPARAGQEGSRMGGSTSGPKTSQQAFGKQETAVTHQPVASAAEADSMVRGQFRQMALGYIQAEGVCYGRNALRAGETVTIEGAGRTFSGDYYLTSVTHSVTPRDGYRTHFRARRNAT